LSDQAQQAVDASGLLRYHTGREIGVAESTMSRFMRAQGGRSLANIDAVADLPCMTSTPCTERRRQTPDPEALHGIDRE
jgi:hypothetical protein